MQEKTRLRTPVPLIAALVALAGCNQPPPRSNATSPCKGVDCSGHGQCAVAEGEVAVCLCSAGYHAGVSGLVCDATVVGDECAAVDCNTGGTCAVSGGQPVCVCAQGFRAVTQTTCVQDTSAVTCGPGTVLTGTQCVPTAPPPGITCGPGTVPSGTQCLPESVRPSGFCIPEYTNSLGAVAIAPPAAANRVYYGISVVAAGSSFVTLWQDCPTLFNICDVKWRSLSPTGVTGAVHTLALGKSGRRHVAASASGVALLVAPYTPGEWRAAVLLLNPDLSVNNTFEPPAGTTHVVAIGGAFGLIVGTSFRSLQLDGTLGAAVQLAPSTATIRDVAVTGSGSLGVAYGDTATPNQVFLALFDSAGAPQGAPRGVLAATTRSASAYALTAAGDQLGVLMHIGDTYVAACPPGGLPCGPPRRVLTGATIDNTLASASAFYLYTRDGAPSAILDSNAVPMLDAYGDMATVDLPTRVLARGDSLKTIASLSPGAFVYLTSDQGGVTARFAACP